ncbi:hypothetical protein PAXINDRAFT_21036 [Paxillus involutus ATCC 200175]|uniref:Uncharacterized protein n=1 Tax=Paxillus involutus ATCC 200175 TaxID=664439 RepID=A0A0C9SM84_PAXIN|nr:hypothetical protein PAXINDRAFT_21036 [Paxillus involutus ATCC 200175]
MFKRRDGGEGSKGLEKTASVEGEVEDGKNEDELEDEEGNVGVNGDHIMDESENLAIPTSGMIRREEANTDNHAGPSGLPANPTDDPDDPDGMAIDGDDLNMYEDCPPGDSAINGPPERPTPQIVPPRKNNSPAPFSFRGGAPCIIPKRQASTTTYPHSHNILSLNSDDEDPTLHKHPKMTMPHNLRPTVSARESDPESAKIHKLATVPAHENGSARLLRTRSPTGLLIHTSDALVKQLQETRLAKLESKRQKREHEKWIREQEAAEADREQELKRTLALERTEQLKLELELERSRERQLTLGGDVVQWMYE